MKTLNMAFECSRREKLDSVDTRVSLGVLASTIATQQAHIECFDHHEAL